MAKLYVAQLNHCKIFMNYIFKPGVHLVSFVQEVGICVCVCLPPRLWIASWHDMDLYNWLNRFYNFYMVTVVMQYHCVVDMA